MACRSYKLGAVPGREHGQQSTILQTSDALDYTRLFADDQPVCSGNMRRRAVLFGAVVLGVIYGLISMS